MSELTRTKVLFLITKSNCGLKKRGTLFQEYAPIDPNLVTRALCLN
jgi:hypothetical protein